MASPTPWQPRLPSADQAHPPHAAAGSEWGPPDATRGPNLARHRCGLTGLGAVVAGDRVLPANGGGSSDRKSAPSPQNERSDADRATKTAAQVLPVSGLRL